MLVTLQSSLPALFEDTGFTDRQPDHFPELAAGVGVAPTEAEQQRTNTSCYLAIPTRGFTAAVSVFRGTPPAKPLKCKYKIRLVRPGDAVFRLWADPTGEASLLVLAKFNVPPEDITWMSLCFCSQTVHLSLTVTHFVSHSGKIKNPAYMR